MKSILEKALKESISYKKYISLLTDAVNKGPEGLSAHDIKMLGYTSLNLKRMAKWDKIVKIQDSVRTHALALSQKEYWLIITEGWCGDAAHILPVIEHIAQLNPLLTTHYVLRDENPDLMDQFLTNGGRSIPIILRLNADTLDIINQYGPRPKERQERFYQLRNNPDFSYPNWTIESQKWYAKDKGQTVQREFL